MRIASLALFALLSAPVSVAMIAPAAAAQTQNDCEAQIAGLRTAVGGVAISGKNAERDRQSLIKTLDAASTELAKGKNADAVTKLNDFKVKVGQLLEGGRISSANASSLTAQADSAIACINGLSAT